ncbi:hypothetical protein SAMN06265348_110199 [Pedobacter westerhofensis]|uniref:Uncharacterized protein n=1 Tax=Pedobacter westerhofensis TaxID=425512 RepID=A0A521F7K0_9SPHI|nr:hypothetical protein SAMN06265348_110199 [Pedobacter westerhofensis]
MKLSYHSDGASEIEYPKTEYLKIFLQGFIQATKKRKYHGTMPL